MRYQSTPEKEFDGDIIITDPCYIIRNENGITKLRSAVSKSILFWRKTALQSIMFRSVSVHSQWSA